MNFLNIDNKQLNELAVRYVDLGIDKDSIWKIHKKGFLYDFFKEDEAKNGNYLVKFSETVKEVLNKKLDLKKASLASTSLSGRWLIFDPTSTMYDEVAEAESSGFFDSDDVPPPEFWVGFYDEVLISYIPENFLSLASLGVDSCISGSLSWSE